MPAWENNYPLKDPSMHISQFKFQADGTDSSYCAFISKSHKHHPDDINLCCTPYPSILISPTNHTDIQMVWTQLISGKISQASLQMIIQKTLKEVTVALWIPSIHP